MLISTDLSAGNPTSPAHSPSGYTGAGGAYGRRAGLPPTPFDSLFVSLSRAITHFSPSGDAVIPQTSPSGCSLNFLLIVVVVIVFLVF